MKKKKKEGQIQRTHTFRFQNYYKTAITKHYGTGIRMEVQTNIKELSPEIKLYV